MSHSTQNSILPNSLEELLEKLQEQGVEEFAVQIINDYQKRLR